MTKEERDNTIKLILFSVFENRATDISIVGVALEKINKLLDTYAMEFLKECLPEKLKQEDAKWLDKVWRIEAHNQCIDQTLNNANNKQNEK